jgi:hypothetical protein
VCPNEQFVHATLRHEHIGKSLRVFKSFSKAMCKPQWQAHAKSVVSTVEREAWPTLITQSLETPEEEMFADTNGISPTIQ